MMFTFKYSRKKRVSLRHAVSQGLTFYIRASINNIFLKTPAASSLCFLTPLPLFNCSESTEPSLSHQSIHVDIGNLAGHLNVCVQPSIRRPMKHLIHHCCFVCFRTPMYAVPYHRTLSPPAWPHTQLDRAHTHTHARTQPYMHTHIRKDKQLEKLNKRPPLRRAGSAQQDSWRGWMSFSS